MLIPGLLLKNDPTKKVIDFNGVTLNIEWLKGSIRSYKNSDFKKKMHASYGYVKGTNTADDDEEIDIYLGDNLDSQTVYKIQQLMGEYEAKETGGTAFVSKDEFKYMLGFDSMDAAKACYIKCMDEKLFGGISEMSLGTFKGVVNRSRTKELSKGLQLIQKHRLQEGNMIEYKDGNNEIGTQLLIKNATDKAELIKLNFMEEFKLEESPSQELFKGWSETQDYGEYLSARRGEAIKDAPMFKMAKINTPQVNPELQELYKSTAYGVSSEEEFDLTKYVQDNAARATAGAEFNNLWQKEDTSNAVLTKMAELYKEVWIPLLKKAAEDLENVEVDLEETPEATERDKEEDKEAYDKTAGSEKEEDFKEELHKSLKARGVVNAEAVERVFIKALLEGNGIDLGKKYLGFKKLVGKIKEEGKSDKAAEEIASAVGRAKYGKKKFQAAAAKGKSLK